MSWQVSRAVARAEVRRTWRSLVAVGVLAGVTAGVVAGTAALAVRTTTAPDRLAAATHLDDARVTLFGGSAFEAPIAALPVVRDSWVAENAVGQVEGGGMRYLSVSYGGPRPAELFTPVVVSGRLPTATAADEIVVTEALAKDLGLGAGSHLALRMLLPEEVYQFDTGFGRPDGPLLDLTVSGVVRLNSRGGNGFGPAFAGPAFYEKYRQLSAGPTMLLRLDPGPEARATLERELARLGEQAAAADPQASEFGPVKADFPSDQVNPQIDTARRVLGTGLVLFALVALAAGLLATAQALGRLASTRREDLRTEAALGLVRSERVLGRLLPATIAVVVAASLAVAGVLAAAAIEPLGALRAFEPELGWLPDWRIAAIGAVAAAVVLVLLVVLATLGAERAAGPGRQTPSSLPSVLLRRPAVLAGASLALGDRGARGLASPSRTTVLGAVLGVTGIVATVTFAVSLHRLEREPTRYGWTADFGVTDVKPSDLVRMTADPQLADVQLVGESSVLLAGRGADVVSLDDRAGAVPTTLVTGRLPQAANEIAVGTRTAKRLKLGTGDEVAVGPKATPYVVTGTVLVPALSDKQLGTTSVLTSAGLAPVQRSVPLTTALLRAADGTDAAAVEARYAETYEIVPREEPGEVRNLRDLGALPLVLELFLALLAVAGLVHALLYVTRRRGRDLGVFRVLGFTPRQVSASLVVMACGVTAVGLVIGIPLGLAVGRLAWAQAASSIGVDGGVVVPTESIVVLVPVALGVAAAAAWLTAFRAGRFSSAAMLRDE